MHFNDSSLISGKTPLTFTDVSLTFTDVSRFLGNTITDVSLTFTELRICQWWSAYEDLSSYFFIIYLSTSKNGRHHLHEWINRSLDLYCAIQQLCSQSMAYAHAKNMIKHSKKIRMVNPGDSNAFSILYSPLLKVTDGSFLREICANIFTANFAPTHVLKLLTVWCFLQGFLIDLAYS